MNQNETSEYDRMKHMFNRGRNLGACLGVLCSLLVAGTAAVCYIERERGIEERTEEAVRAIYEPVGNGGALSAMNGRTSRERKEMLNKVYLVKRINKPHLPEPCSERF
ncbi:hypothetical protein FJZ19_00635 [Candidatus Pacearchaeota archaeon]|nr:hypothetical protein [Candidatus Pacearchaeota archaeon]